MKTLYLECHMGAAGDMLMAALYELLDEEQKKTFLDAMNGLGLPGVEVAPVAAKTSGIAGTHMKVTVHGHEEHEHDHHDHDHHDGCHHEHHHHHHHATPGHIGEIIDGLSLPQGVRDRARKVYDAIAQAEAQAHGCAVGDVHFHEVGALDAVADVVGVCYALHLLAPDLVTASPVHVGSGTVRCAHGVMPVPAPATANLLTGIPIYGGEVQGELCTPTGAALLKTFVQFFGPMGEMDVEKIGYGVGTKEFERANCVRAFWGEEEPRESGDIVELVCNIDDMTPEALAFACQRLLDAGALDAYTTPGTMKKGRPGWVLTVLCDPEQENDIIRQIFAHTTTNGLRSRLSMKYFLKPEHTQVQTQWGPVRVKTAGGFGVTHVKPEFEDVAALAREHGLPYETVYRAAMNAL
ncbi:Pyridinium-3,5-bisthiocarboxylic acid mononucleotide nickel insertion protein [Firmicutes bacterium ASF500]|nr:Pyridinium-3,5-bisthiocarboxylic acid mononucleotide nickel insertion protein [Firmicutes bacterium ASF500]